MKILYLTPFLQHPALQGPTRHYHFLKALSQRHTITLLTLSRSAVTPEVVAEMKSYTEKMFTFDAVRNSSRTTYGITRRWLGRIRYSQRRRKAIRDMKHAFRRLVLNETFDLILFHGKGIFSVIDDCHHPPMVADVCDATSMRILGTMRYSNPIKLPWLLWQFLVVKRLERRIVDKTPHLAFITPRDRDAVLGANGNAIVLPNMVDMSYWTHRGNNPQENCIMYSGGMDYRPNVDGALHLIRDILPIVRASVPDVKVLIVGRDPVRELVEAAQDQPDVTVTGAVADMRPYFERASVYACPLRIASGQQNKLIEAMAMEVPVVTTSIAADGMRVEGGPAPPVIVADDKETFANSIIRQLRNRNDRERLSTQGRRFIEEFFALSRSAEMLEKMCLKAVGTA